MNEIKNTTKKLRHPILDNIEYFDIIKNKQTLKTYFDEINGKNWRDIQVLIGSEFGAGIYRYSFKQINENQIYNGSLRAVGKIMKDDIKENILNKEIENLKSKINSLSNNNNAIGVDVLLAITKQGYETQINFLNSQLNTKDIYINKLENKIDELERELDTNCEIIDDLKSKTGLNQYIELGKMFLNSKLGNVKPIETLKDVDQSDIPPEILNLLGAVNWSLVDKNIIETIINYLNMFIPKLPLKGNL